MVVKASTHGEIYSIRILVPLACIVHGVRVAVKINKDFHVDVDGIWILVVK